MPFANLLIELGRVTVNKLSQLANAPSLMASGAAPSAKVYS